jgi:hypothetical protein
MSSQSNRMVGESGTSRMPLAAKGADRGGADFQCAGLGLGSHCVPGRDEDAVGFQVCPVMVGDFEAALLDVLLFADEIERHVLVLADLHLVECSGHLVEVKPQPVVPATDFGRAGVNGVIAFAHGCALELHRSALNRERAFQPARPEVAVGHAVRRVGLRRLPAVPRREARAGVHPLSGDAGGLVGDGVVPALGFWPAFDVEVAHVHPHVVVGDLGGEGSARLEMPIRRGGRRKVGHLVYRTRRRNDPSFIGSHRHRPEVDVAPGLTQRHGADVEPVVLAVVADDAGDEGPVQLGRIARLSRDPWASTSSVTVGSLTNTVSP